MREFRYILIRDTYVVWLAGPNRFLQLKEPAFFVFSQWTEGMDRKNIAEACMNKYGLPFKESTRFVSEIADETENLYTHTQPGENKNDLSSDEIKSFPPPFSSRIYQIRGKTLRFTFGDEELEEMFHSQFSQFEVHYYGDKPSSSLAVWFQDGHYYLIIPDAEIQQFAEEQYEQFVGAVYVEILQIIHHKSLNDWMGVIHASSITDGKSSVIFTGNPGAGKSTMAALMMAHGFPVLSDDFVPVSMDVPEIFPMPAAISVKKESIPALKSYYPSLENPEKVCLTDDGELYEVFLPFPKESLDAPPVKVKAIVFVKYDPSVTCQLKLESNLEMMNDFLKQTWIANRASAIDQFLDWYFHLPVYTLVYSDSSLAVASLSKILSDSPTLSG